MIENFLNIGFKLSKSDRTKYGLLKEYSYYPEYLVDNHYTLLTYRSHLPSRTLDGVTVDQGTDYRLYVCRNIDGKFIDSPFQLSDRDDLLEKKFKEVFKGELKKLNREYQFDLIFKD